MHWWSLVLDHSVYPSLPCYIMSYVDWYGYSPVCSRRCLRYPNGLQWQIQWGRQPQKGGGEKPTPETTMFHKFCVELGPLGVHNSCAPKDLPMVYHTLHIGMVLFQGAFTDVFVDLNCQQTFHCIILTDEVCSGSVDSSVLLVRRPRYIL